MNKKLLVFLLLITMLFAVNVAVAVEDNNKKDLIIKSSSEPITFSEEKLEKLPYEAKKHISESKYELISSVATIHVIQDTEKGIGEIISKNYDFSKSEDLDEFNNIVELFKTDEKMAYENLGIMSQGQDNHFVIITGLNVDHIPGGQYRQHLQLHGWWEWLTVTYVTDFDRVGLVWTSDFNSNESTHHGWASRYYDGSSFSLPKHN